MRPTYALYAALALLLATGVTQAQQPPPSTTEPAPPAEGPPISGQSNPDLKNGADLTRTEAVSPLEKTPKDTLKSTDTFLKEVAVSNMAEIQAGKLAMDKATDPKVKDFASMMVSDHEKMANDLMQFAQKKNVTLPTDLDARRTAVMKRLGEQKDFDKAYLQQMVHDHEELLGFMKRYGSKMPKDTDTSALLASAMPVIQKHRDEAVALLKTHSKKT